MAARGVGQVCPTYAPAEIDERRAEIAMLKEEIRIKDTRMAAIPPNRRPRYAPIMRMSVPVPRPAQHTVL